MCYTLFYPLTPVCLMHFPNWQAMQGWSLYIITDIFFFIVSQERNHQLLPLLKTPLAKSNWILCLLNFMVFFSMMKQSIKPKRPFHLFQDPTIWNSIKEIISKRNNIFILLKKSSQRGITKRWKRKLLNWITWSYSLY